MQIIIRGKNIQVTPEMESAIIKKVGGLKKFLASFENHSMQVTEGRQLFETFVEVSRETNHHNKGNIFKTEIKMYLPGKNLFAKAVGEEIMKTVIEAREELESEIRKYKAKVVEFPRRQAKQSKTAL